MQSRMWWLHRKIQATMERNNRRTSPQQMELVMWIQRMRCAKSRARMNEDSRWRGTTEEFGENEFARWRMQSWSRLRQIGRGYKPTFGKNRHRRRHRRRHRNYLISCFVIVAAICFCFWKDFEQNSKHVPNKTSNRSGDTRLLCRTMANKSLEH